MIKGLFFLLLLVSLSVGPAEATSKKCKDRGKAVEARVEELRKSANALIPVGSSKEAVARFFEANKLEMSLDSKRNEASDSFPMTGCGPYFFCGDDVRVRVLVEFDDAGKVKKTTVGAMYVNCL